MITITGASDDIILIKGDIDEEFDYSLNNHGALLAFSDGTLLRIVYNREGLWRITPVVLGTTEYRHTPATVGDDTNYSDTVTLTGPVRWVATATSYAHRTAA